MERRGETYPAISWKSKTYPNIAEKGPYSVHLWVKYSIQNAVLRVSRRKNSKIFPVGHFYFVFLTKSFSDCPNSINLPCPKKLLVARLISLRHWCIHGNFMSFSEAVTWDVLWKKVFLKAFATFTGKLQAYNFIKKRLQHTCFPLNIAKYLR